MRSRSVAFSEAAQSDLIELEAQLEPVAGKEVARRYVDRLVDYCWRLDLAPERGTPRDDLWLGLHIALAWAPHCRI